MTWTNTIHLRAEDKETFMANVPEEWFITPEEGDPFLPTQTETFAIDLIGAIVTDAGEYDEEGEVITPPTIDERFHANLILREGVALPESLAQFVIEVGHPRRVFA
jgi:hypothetical protein